jgi:beta-glucosidase
MSLRLNLLLLCIVTMPTYFQVRSFERENLARKEIRWDWNIIEPIALEDLKFPAHFMWGIATSGHQVDGHCNCQWTTFENRTNWLGSHYLERSGAACDHWNLFKQDIDLLKELGVRAYRFSLEWSKIEPEKGHFNQDALNHYHEFIDYALAQQITPVITLHHFTHPQWFEDLQAFEKEENLPLFVRYCTAMVTEFGSKVPLWCTFNEPGVYAFQGYVRGAFPPAKTNLHLTGVVTKNLILGHIKAYKAMKALPQGRNCQIGITHSITIFDPYHPDNKFEQWLTSSINHIFYDALLQFFVTGKFSFKAPKIVGLFLAGSPYMMFIKPTSTFPFLKTEWHCQVTLDYEEIEGKPYQAHDILDFFGIQPYSNVLVDITNVNAAKNPTARPGSIKTDMPYCIYPEIIERAVNVASYIGVPLYITENGIADSQDDRRELYIRRYLYALSKTLEKGYDIRGYFYWSLLDNFEWNLGYGKKFGLYEVDFVTQQRKLREGGKYYKKVLEHHHGRHTSPPDL